MKSEIRSCPGCVVLRGGGAAGAGAPCAGRAVPALPRVRLHPGPVGSPGSSGRGRGNAGRATKPSGGKWWGGPGRRARACRGGLRPARPRQGPPGRARCAAGLVCSGVSSCASVDKAGLVISRTAMARLWLPGGLALLGFFSPLPSKNHGIFMLLNSPCLPKP